MTFKPQVFVKKFLGFLRALPLVGGMEISDSVVRFAYFDGDQWQIASLRLPPGIIVKGEVRDYPSFVDALKGLKSQIALLVHRRHDITLIVSLSSVNIYTQVFSLPMIEGENLEKAIQLNVQMASSAEQAEKYSGWQLAGEDPHSVRLEILSAFIDRALIDAMVRALREAGFLIAAVESRALSLTRLLRERGAGFDPEKPGIVIHVDSAGLEFLVVRRGQLYFQYFHLWDEVRGEERSITSQVFEATIVRNFHQVLNFYNAHWQEPVVDVFLSTSAMADDILRIVNENFSVKVHPLLVREDMAQGPEWFIAMGAGLRGLIPRRADQNLSLLGIGAQDEFRREQILRFTRFWRILMPVPLLLLVGVFVATNIFLTRTYGELEAKHGSVLRDEQSKQIRDLQIQIQSFNRSVALIEGVLGNRNVQTPLFQRIASVFSDYGIALKRYSFQAASVPIGLSGSAASEDQILKLKRALDLDPTFNSSVNLNLSDIVADGQGFSFSFTLLASATSSSNTR